MHAQGREQTHYALGHAQRDLGQRAVFADRAAGQAVDATRHAVQLACGDEAGQQHRGQPTRTQVARRLAALKGFDFGDEYDASHQYANQPLYLVPTDTLSRAQLAALPQVDPNDPLFGGVVPYAFVATKAITHPLPHPGASAPKGWSTEFGKRVVIWNKEWALDSDGDDQECVIKAFMNGDVIQDIHFTGDEAQCYRFADKLKQQ